MIHARAGCLAAEPWRACIDGPAVRWRVTFVPNGAIRHRVNASSDRTGAVPPRPCSFADGKNVLPERNDVLREHIFALGEHNVMSSERKVMSCARNLMLGDRKGTLQARNGMLAERIVALHE